MAAFAFIGLNVLVLIGLAFFLFMQTYTLLLEMLIIGFALLLGIIELIMMIFAFISFSSMENSQ